MARNYAIITAIGGDRVGIVDDLSALVTEAGGNIEESKMAVLGGDFAVMMLVSFEGGGLDGFAADLPRHQSALGLHIELKPTGAKVGRPAGRPYLMEVVSLDGQGIVHAVSAVLRKHGANIEELETRTEGAPLTGAPLFRMKATVVVVAGSSVANLRRDLEGLEESRELDISLAPLHAPGLD